MTNRKKIRCGDNPMTETKATKMKTSNNNSRISNSNRKRDRQDEKSHISNSSLEMTKMTNNKFKTTLKSHNIVVENWKITKMISKTITNELSIYHIVFFHKIYYSFIYTHLWIFNNIFYFHIKKFLIKNDKF